MTVTNAQDLAASLATAGRLVVRVSGQIAISGQLKVASDKTILGVGKTSGITGGGLNIRQVSNVIVANLTFTKPVGTDSVSVYGSSRVLVTHNDFSSDRTKGKDFYDGLIDITQGSDLVTVSFNRFHNHFKVMLIGGSDNTAGVDRGKLRVTVHHNSFVDVGSRLPSLRFGTGHVYNNVMTRVGASGIHARMGATILAQNNVMVNVSKPLVSDADGGSGRIIVDPATPPAWPYAYTLTPKASVESVVAASAGPR